jgi:F420H(2)-dependent quinone reductase
VRNGFPLHGAPTHPDWYHNLVAYPDVSVEVGTESFEARATVVEGGERDELYAKRVAVMPTFAEYQAMTTHTIPVGMLTRKAKRSGIEFVWRVTCCIDTRSRDTSSARWNTKVR